MPGTAWCAGLPVVWCCALAALLPPSLRAGVRLLAVVPFPDTVGCGSSFLSLLSDIGATNLRSGSGSSLCAHAMPSTASDGLWHTHSPGATCVHTAVHSPPVTVGTNTWISSSPGSVSWCTSSGSVSVSSTISPGDGHLGANPSSTIIPPPGRLIGWHPSPGASFFLFFTSCSALALAAATASVLAAALLAVAAVLLPCSVLLVCGSALVGCTSCLAGDEGAREPSVNVLMSPTDRPVALSSVTLPSVYCGPLGMSSSSELVLSLSLLLSLSSP